MKTKLRRISKRTLALFLGVLMLITSVGVGTLFTANAANSNNCWYAKKVYFVVPESWDLSTYSHVQVDVTRTTSSSSSNYQSYIATMTRVGTSRLYQATINSSHSGWNQTEYLSFTANDHDYGSGTFALNGNVFYTTPVDYELNNSNNYYLAVPNSDANGCAVTMSYNTDRDTLMKKTQTATVRTNKASSSTGGSVSLSGYYFSSDTAITSSSSSPSYDSVLGTTMTMTATANTGYTFDGWYSNSNCTTLLSTDTEYSYTVSGAKTVYANFTPITYTVTYNKGSNGTGTNTTDTKTYGVDLTLKDAIFTRSGYTQKGWSTAQAGTTKDYELKGTYSTNSPKTLYPYWEANTYTITYKDGGNTAFSGTHASGYPTSYTYGVGATLKSATKDNYIFGGWFDNSSCTGTAVTSISTTATGNKTYYAKWTLAATPQLASISNVSKTVNDTTFNVSATINNSNYASGTLSVTASSGTTSVATVGTVSKSGDNVTIPLTVKGPGTSTITVTLKDGSTTVDTKTFTVTVAEPTFTIAAQTIYANSKDVAACTVTNGGTAPSSIAWSSGTTANVAVNASTGTLTAKKINSSSIITATATYACGYTKSATATVTVANPTLTIKAGATSGVIGTTTTASVDSSSSPTVSTTTVDSYAWTTSDSTVVGLSSPTAASPTLTFKKAGTATIRLTVTYKNNSLTKTATNTVSITVSDASVSFSTTTTASLNVGGTVTRTATGSTVGSAASTTMEYSGTNDYISVNSTTGEVTALKPTSSNQTVTATYTVTCGGQTTTKTATYTVKVNTPTITMSGQTVAKGDSVTFSATTTNPTGLTIAYSLKSAVSGVSINSSTGVVTVTSGCTATSATVVATAKNSAGTAVATKEAALTIQAPSVTLTNTNIADGTTIYATVGTNVTSTASNNFSGSYTVSSSKTSVATVTMNNSKLTITPAAKGKTTITVTAYKGTSISVTKTFTVKVAEAETYKYLYFTNGVGYTTPKVYFYGDGENGNFPGETMVKIGQNNNSEDVYAIRYPAAKNYTNVIISDNGDNDKRVQISGTTDIALSSEHNAIWCTESKKDDKAGWWDCNISRPQVSIDDISDLPITTTTTMTAELLNNVVPSSYSWSSDTPANVTVSNTTTATNTLTGVYPGTSTITVRAYSPLPADDWTFETTDAAAVYIAGTATATVTTTATPKSVTWGKMASYDNGQNFNTAITTGGNVTVSPSMTSGGTVAHGTQVTFTAPTISGYKFAGWQVNGDNSITSTTTKTVQITENTTVYALYYKTYTVKLTRKLDNTDSTDPFKTTQYRNAASGDYSTYNSTLTVNAGSPVYFKVSYDNGYQYSSVTNATVETANTVFKIAAVSANTTVTLTATKTNYNLTGQVSPTGHGSVKFYSDSACTVEINTAQINDTIYAKYISADGYVLKSFAKKSGTGAHAVLGTRSGNVIPITMGYENLTITATAILEYSVTYYVDMHSSSVTSLSAAVVTTSGGGTIQTDSSGAQCSATLSKQGDSSVYAATINTPVTQSGSTYNPVYLKITYNGTSYANTLASANVQTLAGKTDKEVWLEAANESAAEKRVATATNTTTSVASGYKRIYVAKPYDWQTSETAWKNIGLYYWTNGNEIAWTATEKMHYIGYDSTSGYHYYYYDMPTTTAKHIIFQGWGDNESISADSDIKAQTEDIELSTNYYVLSHDGGSYKGTAGDNVSVPAYTRYAATATLNKGDTASIAPTTSNTVVYSSSDDSVATVVNSGDTAGTVTAVGRGTATITVTVYGTIGAEVTDTSNADKMQYTTDVTVKDPSYFAGFNIMSLESNTSTITIPTVLDETKTPPQSVQPGYFDDIAVTVSGLANSGTYTNSAIVTTPSNGTWTGTIDGESVTKDVTYIVKYAKANSTFSGYSAISVTADVVSKSIRYSGANRYGYSEWTITPSGDTAPTATTKVDGGIETATTKGITLLGKTYSEVFEPYTYVDVTFTFNYYTYKTKRTVFKLDDEGNKIPKRDNQGAIIEGEYETEKKEFYQYDADYIDPDNHGVAGYSDKEKKDDYKYYNDAEDRDSPYFDESKHESVEYTVENFEIRNKSAANLKNGTETVTVAEAAAAIADMPDNDYYNYKLTSDNEKSPDSQKDRIKCTGKTGDYNAEVTVELLHAPKKYIVKLDGSNVTNGNDGSRNEGTNYYFYQEYTTLSSSDSMNWCVTDVNNTSTGTPLANGKSYKFRVAGNTYIKGVPASIPYADFNRSKVTNAGQQITHEAKSSTNQTIVEKLTNNFYISDFFAPENVVDTSRGNNGTYVENNITKYYTHDDVKFVGGGVVYYQVKDGVVDSKVEDAGYANSSGVGIKNSIADFIQEKIESASVPNEIESTDLRNEIAYGTEIAAKADTETGLRYRYLPYNVFTRDNGTLSTGLKDDVSGNVLIQQLDSNNVPVTRTVDGENVPVYYTFATETSSNTFRYSNTLRAYQYIYADKKENKEANAGKNMRLYAYYIYSYTEYDKDTGIPSTVYKVVLSDEYADASTYWNNTNTNN